MEHVPDCIGAHLRQPVRGATKRTLEGAQRPSGRAILLAIRGAPRFRQDSLPLSRGVGGRRSAPMLRLDGGEALAVETTYPLRDRISALASGDLCNVRVGTSVGDRKERLGPSHMGRRFGLRTANLLQPQLLCLRERTQRID
jgi:hypothetical protein